VGGEDSEDLILDVPEGELDFTDAMREYEAHTFEDDFDHQLPDLEPLGPDDVELLANEDLEELQAQDRMLNESGIITEWDDDEL